MATFEQVTHEDFSGIIGSARHVDTTTSAGNSIVELINPWVDKTGAENTYNPLLDNFFSINQAVTPSYCTKAPGGSKLINWIFGSDNTAVPYDDDTEHGPMSGYYLSGRVQQNNSTGEAFFTNQTIDGNKHDGYLTVQEPHFTSFGRAYHKDHGVQTGIRVKLRFDNLQPFTWVPLVGIARTAGDDYTAINTPDDSNFYSKDGIGHGYYAPPLANTDNNVWGAANSGGWGTHMVCYFIYCHDGQGNALLATCAGMSPDGHPYAAYHASKTGTPHSNPTNAYYGTKNGFLKWKAPKILTDAFDSNQSLTALFDTYKNNSRNWWAASTNFTYDSSWADRGNSSWANFWHTSSIIGMKQGATNADLKNTEEIFINIAPHAANTTNPYNMNRWGVIWAQTSNNDSRYSHHGSFNYTATGKIGDFVFVHQPIFSGFEYTNETYSYATPKQIVLHASADSDGIIEEFSLGGYTPATRLGRQIGDGPFKGYMGPHNTLEFIYPGDGHTYDPLKGAHGNAARQEIDNGAFVNVDNLLDNSDGTNTSIVKRGPDNALYLKLQGVGSGATVNDDEIIQEFTVTLRGLTQLTIDAVEIKMAVTNSSKEVLMQSTPKQAISTPGGELINNQTKYPLDGVSGFVVTFSHDGTSNFNYGNVKDGYLKIWVEDQPDSA